MILVPTGFMGTGSSAITDILSEIQGFIAPHKSFEYVFLHCPNGVFDLEDKLLRGNNAIRSDEAIFEFENRMKSLYNKKNFWPGSYDKMVSKKFMRDVESFIDSIVSISIENTHWYFQSEPMNISTHFILYFRRAIKKITLGRIKIPRPYRYDRMRLAFPTSEQYYSAAQTFINKVIQELNVGDNHLIIDQLLLPHNLFRIKNYFDDKLKVFVVDRDPRDLFLLNKYIWRRQEAEVPYPIDVISFCKYYRLIRSFNTLDESDSVCHIRFEDLIYNYERSMNKIYSFLNIDPALHKEKRQKFNPSISIKNTQLFKDKRITQSMKEESEMIADSLNDFIYPFPNEDIRRNGFNELF